MTPYGHTHHDRHVDQRRQPDGKRRQEQTLVRMSKYRRPQFRIEQVSQRSDDAEDDEEDEVEHEEDDGDDLEPVAVVGELVQEEG